MIRILKKKWQNVVSFTAKIRSKLRRIFHKNPEVVVPTPDELQALFQQILFGIDLDRSY